METTLRNETLETFIRSLDQAVDTDCIEQCAQNVKVALEQAFADGAEIIPSEYLGTCKECYARHLLHIDPQNRYSVIVMVWDKGQGTPLHDHAGMWCVECVYRGEIRVQPYSLQGCETDTPIRFEKENSIVAHVGEAGALIPPFDYHTIENVLETPSVTVHVYGGEMKWCNAFMPVEGGYEKIRKELVFH